MAGAKAPAVFFGARPSTASPGRATGRRESGDLFSSPSRWRMQSGMLEPRPQAL